MQLISRIVNDDCFPYIAGVNKCKIKRTDTLASAGCALPTKVPRNHLYRVGPAYSLNNETDIMIEIMESGPVQGNSQAKVDGPLTKYNFFLSNNACVSRLLRIQRGNI